MAVQGQGRPVFAGRAPRPGWLPPVVADMVRVANRPGFDRWLDQVRATGGCARPVHLSGRTTTVDALGRVLRHYDTSGEPGGRLSVRCRNRRASVCPSCSRQHAGDTYHLVRAGLTGGKGVAVPVGPRVFVTLTAPSFGRVHRAGRCHPVRSRTCVHGVSTGCGGWHRDADTVVGSPVCPVCYDYAGHVLWHAMAGRLWTRWTHAVRRRLATAGGIKQAALGDHVVVAYAKVAEYQARAAVHFHAVVRLDGPGGPGSSLPSWATAELLGTAIAEATAAVAVPVPHDPAVGVRVVRFGKQLDVREIAAESAVTSGAVAGYLAKYVSKGTGAAGGTDTPVRSFADLHAARVTPHVRALMLTAWRLGGLRALACLRLRRWTHTLGFRGHVMTKSRAYSVTYGALRAARALHRQGTRPPAGVTSAVWRYVGQGWSLGEAQFARGVWAESCERQLDRPECGP